MPIGVQRIRYGTGLSCLSETGSCNHQKLTRLCFANAAELDNISAESETDDESCNRVWRLFSAKTQTVFNVKY